MPGTPPATTTCSTCTASSPAPNGGPRDSSKSGVTEKSRTGLSPKCTGRGDSPRGRFTAAYASATLTWAGRSAVVEENAAGGTVAAKPPLPPLGGERRRSRLPPRGAAGGSRSGAGERIGLQEAPAASIVVAIATAMLVTNAVAGCSWDCGLWDLGGGVDCRSLCMPPRCKMVVAGIGRGV